MTDTLEQVQWPVARLGEALAALGRKRGLTGQAEDTPAPPADLTAEDARLDRWVAASADALELEAEPVHTPYAEIETFLTGAAPALLRVPDEDGNTGGILALLRGGRRALTLVAPDLSEHRVDRQWVRELLCRPLEAPVRAEIDAVLDGAGVPPNRRPHARRVILDERLADATVPGWLVRLSPRAGMGQQVRHAGIWKYLLTFVGAHAVQYLLWLVSWAVIGRAVLQGRFEQGWFVAWILLLLSILPLRTLVAWGQERFAIGIGSLLKRRFLYGALRLEPNETRHRGVGQFLSRILEAEAMERLALDGGFLGIVAIIELSMAVFVLAAGAGGWLHVALLFVWIGVTLAVEWIGYRRRSRWTDDRLDMTHVLVERMVGHRTRLAQQSPEQWHDDEDRALDQFLERSLGLDQMFVATLTLVPRGWLIVGILGLVPAFMSGQSSIEAIGIGLGGTLLAHRALRKLSPGLWHLAGALISWQRVSSLFDAATRPKLTGAPDVAVTRADVSDDAALSDTILDARDLVFSYQERSRSVLDSVAVRIRAGDRILLEGPSGGGKSTLASLLTGLRTPDAGLMLLNGLDRQTLGEDGWRRRVAAAPQFHENHVLTETFAFNLLMGRRWPPTREDMEEAMTICQELGLGEVLQRMPAGPLQLVGETGWQLSHGERSRLYIARALLQEGDVVVLDESFSALDPENLRRALDCVLDRAPTLVLIAHP